MVTSYKRPNCESSTSHVDPPPALETASRPAATDNCDCSGSKIPHPPEGRQYELQGVERFLAMSPEGCNRVAHVLAIECPHGPVLQYRYLVPAFGMVINRHPFMRARMSPSSDEPMTAYIRPPDMADADVEKLVSILPADNKSLTHNEQICQLVEEVCNQTVNRQVQYPYFLMVHTGQDKLETTPPGTGTPSVETLTLLLISDHTFSDGFAGMVVFDELLSNIRKLVLRDQENGDLAQVCDKIEELPLRPSLYEQIRGKKLSFWQRCFDSVISGVGGKVMARDVVRFQPIFSSIRDDQEDIITGVLPLPVNPSYFLMDSGTKDNLEAALSKCRSERVTLNGAIIASILLAVAKMKFNVDPTSSTRADSPNNKHTTLKLGMDVAINARKRVKSPFPEPYVGYCSSSVRLDFLVSEGVPMSSRVWNVARQAQQRTDRGILDSKAVAGIIFCHHNFRVGLPTKFTMKKGLVSDVELSNLGRYPFALVHDLGNHGNIRIKGLHFCSSMPNVSYGVALNVSSTDHLSYCLMSKLSNENERKLFHYMVQAVEAISKIDTHDTMLEACQRIFGA